MAKLLLEATQSMPNEMIVSVCLHIVLQAQHFIPSVIVFSSSVHFRDAAHCIHGAVLNCTFRGCGDMCCHGYSGAGEVVTSRNVAY